MKAAKVYINGKFYGKAEAAVSVYDHGLLYGDGVFEGIRCYGGRVFRLEEHIRRLYDSARAVAIGITETRKEMEDIVLEAVRINEKPDCYIRLVVTRGTGDLGLNPDNCGKSTVIAIVDDIALYPREIYEKGIAIITAATRRTGPDSLDPGIKSLNYLNNIMARIEAKRAGCMEAVMLNREGFVAECTGDNIFIVRDGQLATPHPSAGILRGITRDTAMVLARGMGIIVSETLMTRYDLYRADECFLTGTGAEIMPVVSVDGRPVGTGMPGQVTKMISHAYRSLVYGEAKTEKV